MNGYYLLVGRDSSGKRFRRTHTNGRYLSAINCFYGNLYFVEDGKRKLVKTWRN